MRLSYTMEYDGYPYLVGIKNTWYEGYTILLLLLLLFVNWYKEDKVL